MTNYIIRSIYYHVMLKFSKCILIFFVADKGLQHILKHTSTSRGNIDRFSSTMILSVQRTIYRFINMLN